MEGVALTLSDTAVILLDSEFYHLLPSYCTPINDLNDRNQTCFSSSGRFLQAAPRSLPTRQSNNRPTDYFLQWMRLDSVL